MTYSILILLLFILSHYFAGQLVFNTFKFKKRKHLAYSLPALASLLFVLSTIIINYRGDLVFNYLYIISAALFGLVTQLLIFGTIFYVLKYIFVKRKLLARTLFSLAVIIFLLGIYNALFPQIKRMELNNLSNNEGNISIVHLSDLHLGLIYQPSYLENLVDKVNKIEADVVVISGDLFDGNDLKIRKFIPALKGFEKPVIFAPGNHDHYINEELLTNTVSEAGFYELRDEAYTIEGVEFIGFDYLSDQDSNTRRAIDNLSTEKEDLRVVINHVPVDQAEAHALGADLMLSGHAHRGQISPFSIVVRYIYG
jgi:predicted MPP superfamily phosphohydrolase